MKIVFLKFSFFWYAILYAVLFVSTNVFFFSWSRQLIWKDPRYLNVASEGNFVSNYVIPNEVAGLGTTSDVISGDD